MKRSQDTRVPPGVKWDSHLFLLVSLLGFLIIIEEASHRDGFLLREVIPEQRLDSTGMAEWIDLGCLDRRVAATARVVSSKAVRIRGRLCEPQAAAVKTSTGSVSVYQATLKKPALLFLTRNDFYSDLLPVVPGKNDLALSWVSSGHSHRMNIEVVRHRRL